MNSVSKGALSLPKIKEEDGRVLKEIHRVRWSIAPHCLLAGHKQKEVLYICVHPCCEERTRLACETCFFHDHQHHNEHFMAVDEVRSGKINKLRFWPFASEFRPLFDFVFGHEGHVSTLIEETNALFNGMAMRILSTLDKMRLTLLAKIDEYYIQETARTDVAAQVKVELERCFDLPAIQAVVRQLFSKEIRHEVFQDKMRSLLNDTSHARDTLLKYFQTVDKGRELVLDKTQFRQIEEQIVRGLQGQQNVLREEDQSRVEGIERIAVQTIAYLERKAEGLYPLTFQRVTDYDGSKYVGFLSGGVRTVLGKRTYGDESVYTGQWRIDGRNGWGVLQKAATGYKYVGNWKQDRKHGFGREEDSDGIFQGTFANGKREGFGVLARNSTRIEIAWKDGKMHGTGKLIQQNGSEKQVYFLHGLESKIKFSKTYKGADLKELTKKYSKSTITTSQT